MCDNEICGKHGASAGIACVLSWVCMCIDCAVKTISENLRRHADGAIIDAREAWLHG